MKKVTLFLEKWGLHTFLLPLFFVTHSYLQYYGLVSASVAICLCLIIILCIAALFVIVLAMIKNANKALQLVTLVSFIVLFFGVIKDFLSLTLHFSILAKYSVLLPLIVVVVFFLSRTIVKKNDFRKSNFFQNILLLLFLALDIGKLFVFDHAYFLKGNLLVKRDVPAITNTPTPDTKPDVYFLVFDSYPGTTFLREFMNYDNTAFNHELEKLGFYIVKNSRSNYNRTVFSIASTLNFEHLQNIRANDISSKDYAHGCLSIKEAIVPRFFLQHNYSFFNLSIFDIGTRKAIRRETFLTAPEQDILLYNTLLQRVKNDILWNLLEGKYAMPAVRKLFIKSTEESQREFMQKNDFNKTVLDSLDRIPFQQNGSPKFVYAHLYLPHPPFFYDENGRKNDLSYILTQPSLRNKDLFLSYLRYTNKKITGLVKTIQKASANKSIIIIQSDHGFRDFEGGPNHPEAFFTNYSAFYFPDKNYSTLYDTLTNVNTFPIVLNKYFKTRIPMRSDSSVFLPY
jgi:hypothetical protein